MANGNGNGVARTPRPIGRSPMPLRDLVYYNPNRPDATEAIWQPFYDYQTYAAAGATSMIFFQTPNGQGGRTFADTNMVLAGQFPAPTAFLCTAIMIVFFPGLVPSTTSTTAIAQTNVNDVVAVHNGGLVELTIGSKVYMRDAPIGKFPPNFTIDVQSSYLGSTTAPAMIQTNFARAKGRYAEITPFLIPQSQNFDVTLKWPTAVSVTTTGRIGLILDGFYYRQSP